MTVRKFMSRTTTNIVWTVPFPIVLAIDGQHMLVGIAHGALTQRMQSSWDERMHDQ